MFVMFMTVEAYGWVLEVELHVFKEVNGQNNAAAVPNPRK
jgi:hypothetical protein